jgi:hypothetical protein
MNIDKATLTELQNEALFNDELFDFIENEKENAENFIGSQSVEELRTFIGDWVINNSEA